MLKAEEILEKVTNEIVIEIMEENGSPLYRKTIDGRTKQECYWFRTICHGGDSHKLCYFTKSKDFFCYTSCGKMPFWEFIKRIKNIDDKNFYKAVKYVADKLGITEQKTKYGVAVDLKDINEDNNNLRRIVDRKKDHAECENFYDAKNQKYDDTILGYFERDVFYKGWLDEGISRESMKKFGISWYEYKNHIIIPHYDIDGNLIGIRRRSLNPEDVNNKYMPECVEEKTYEHSLGINLYGLYQNKDQIRNTGIVTIVEGEKSVLLSDTYYGDESNAVATCGFNISGVQLMLLRKIGAKIAYIGFDKDYDITKPGIYEKTPDMYNGFIRYKEKLNLLAMRCREFGIKPRLMLDRWDLLDIKDSPFDKGAEVFEKIKDKSLNIDMDLDKLEEEFNNGKR